MLESLSLVNFKAFRDARIPLRPFTLLSGLNSSGKSSVLQSVALLRQSFAQGRLLAEQSRPSLLLNGDLVQLGTAQDVLHEDFGPAAGFDGPAIGLGIREDGRDYAWTAPYDPARPEQDVLPLRPAGPGNGDEPEPRFVSRPFQYLKADRIVPATSYPRSYQIAIGLGFLGVSGEHTVYYLQHHATSEVRPALRHPQAVSPLLPDQLNAWMQELCPGVNLQAHAIENTDTVRLSYGFGASAGLTATRRRRPTNVGFGLTYVLPIVVACLTAEPGSLLLLENPEAHLHPRGQTRMAELICAAVDAGAQALVETHSDHVLNGIRLAVKGSVLTPGHVMLHYFRGDGSGVEITSPRVGPDGMLSDWPDGFFDEWESTLDRLLD